jgi:nicotinate-nucleotide adenylyltransferase
MVIGLLGGSFNPAHEGHRHVAELAMRRLRLDQVWLLVSPGNPLKAADGMGAPATRLASARAIADGRRVVATGIEATIRTRYSIDTVRALTRLFPRAKFVWLMGADILAELSRWRRWREFSRNIVLAVLPRPGQSAKALRGAAATAMRHALKDARTAAIFARLPPPGWIYLPAAEHTASATAIRAARKLQPPEQADRQTAAA